MLLTDEIRRVLFAPPTRFRVDVALTWGCNLRCGHCTVLYKLVDRPAAGDLIDVEALEGFLRRYLAEYPDVSEGVVGLIGGEPFTDVARCEQVVALARRLPVPARLHCTTNLAYDLEDRVLAVLRSLDVLIVSVDGDQESHDRQRRPLTGPRDAYTRTLANIDHLLDAGIAPATLRVQAAVPGPLYTHERRRRFYETFLRLGVPFDNITFGTPHPTRQNTRPSEVYLAARRRVRLRERPCCQFRWMSNFAASGRTLSAGYYESEACVLGPLDSPVADIAAAYERHILDHMPALHDETCMACPALRRCWGACANSDTVLVHGRPSQFCDRAGMIAAVAADDYT